MIRAAVISLALSASAASAETFVVLAYDAQAMTGAFATGDDVAAVQAKALATCGTSAAACQVVFTRAETCIGLAVDYRSGGWGATVGTGAADAEQNVLAHCASFGNTSCQVVETRCASETLETK